MKWTAVIGIILIVVGALALAYRGITYTNRKKVLDIGSIQATTKTEKTIRLPPVLSSVVMAGGIVLVVASRKSK